MDKFFESLKQPKPLKKINNLNDLMFIKKIGLSEYLPLKRTPGPPGFTGKLYQIFREEVTPFLYCLFQKMEVKKAHVTLLCKRNFP